MATTVTDDTLFNWYFLTKGQAFAMAWWSAKHNAATKKAKR